MSHRDARGLRALDQIRDVDTVRSFVGGIEVIGLLPDGTLAECCPG
jgi:hypothetical protein